MVSLKISKVADIYYKSSFLSHLVTINIESLFKFLFKSYSKFSPYQDLKLIKPSLFKSSMLKKSILYLKKSTSIREEKLYQDLKNSTLYLKMSTLIREEKLKLLFKFSPYQDLKLISPPSSKDFHIKI